MEEILRAGFAELGLPLDAEALRRFRSYYEYLTERNREMNLTAIAGEEQTARLHFLDCCALLAAADFTRRRVIDVGSGAGFPGLPLKIASPGMDITLLDSLGKRTDFLSAAARLLGLEGVTVVCARAEEAPPELREGFDIAVSRAVARLNVHRHEGPGLRRRARRSARRHPRAGRRRGAHRALRRAGHGAAPRGGDN